ncbi:hypothetical protein FACS1894140_2310 [Spirochaetia bacterium]|nr:hypothetical protein FACS1894140_2310 [Spirochaetia bacterium]
MGSEKRNFIIEFIRFNIVGIINTVITYALYSLFVFIGIPYKLALVMEYGLGIFSSFFLHRKFTFRATGAVTIRSMLSMIVSYLIILGINLALLTYLVEKCMLNAYFAQIIAMGFSVILSFLAQKYIVFYKKAQE